LPNLNAGEMARSLAVTSNDMLLATYLASLVRAVVALHGLIDNKEEAAFHEAAAQAVSASRGRRAARGGGGGQGGRL
jgi:hypothetical protein